MDIHIREATERDLESISELAKSGEPGIRANNQMIYFLAVTVLSHYVFLIEYQGTPVGYIFAIKHTTRPVLWIHQLVIHPNYRNKGLAYLLIKRVEQVAIEEGFEALELMVKPDNAARDLYERVGFSKMALHTGLNMILYNKELVYVKNNY